MRALTLSDALAEHRPEPRRLQASTWGAERDFRTWDSPAVADLAWGTRKLELRLLRELFAGRLQGVALERAAREWAFEAHGWVGRRGGWIYAGNEPIIQGWIAVTVD